VAAKQPANRERGDYERAEKPGKRQLRSSLQVGKVAAAKQPSSRKGDGCEADGRSGKGQSSLQAGKGVAAKQPPSRERGGYEGKTLSLVSEERGGYDGEIGAVGAGNWGNGWLRKGNR
jgi:hypothetical protein